MRRALCALLLGVASCTVGPNFTPPADPAIPAWKDPSATAGVAVTARTDPNPAWWNSFNDPVLTQLIARAIAGNPSLQQSVLRIVEARQNVVAARAAGLPTLTGNASYMREQLGTKGILESQGAYSDINDLANRLAPLNVVVPNLSNRVSAAGDNALNRFAQPSDLFQYGLDASWELDLFGRVRRSVEQARAQTVAQQEAANDALLVLESDVAQAYIQLRAAQALLVVQQGNVRTTQDALDLTQRRQRSGLATDLDVEQARTQRDAAEQQLPGYEKQAQQARNQLNMLVGEPPGTIDAMLVGAPQVPSTNGVIGVGVPSALARRRPDIRQAEAQLHAATAQVGVAVASFYPDVSLTGSLGLRAIDATYITNWASHFYSAGPTLSLPVFEGGRLTANLRLARAQAVEAGLQYRATVLNALREVEDALVAYRTDRTARDRLADTVASAGTTLYLARNRYEHGLSDFIQVLDAERTLDSDRQQLVQADMMLADDVVALYRALGGGWQSDAATLPAAPAIDPAPPPTPAAADSLAAPTRP